MQEINNVSGDVRGSVSNVASQSVLQEMLKDEDVKAFISLIKEYDLKEEAVRLLSERISNIERAKKRIKNEAPRF